MKKKLIRNTKQTCEYKQEKIVKFFWEQTDEIFAGKNLVCDDNSIVFLPNVDCGYICMDGKFLLLQEVSE